MHDLTAIIKTFERPKALDRLLASMRRHVPQLRVIVADDSFTPRPRTDVPYVQLPPDVGLSAGRNALVDRVETPYFLLLDDDVEFTDESTIQRLLDIVRSGQADLAGGEMYRAKKKFGGLWTKIKETPFHGLLALGGGELRMLRGWRGSIEGFAHDQPAYDCDITHNFFVARTDAVSQVGGWDEELKVEEHAEFFVRFRRAGNRVAYCPSVRIRHWSDRPEFYRKHRERPFRPLAAQKLGITRWVVFDGRVEEYPPAEQSRAA